MKKNERYAIHNSTIEGGVILEGHATLIRKDPFQGGIDEPYERWLVHFDGDAPSELFARTIDPAARLDASPARH